MLLRLSYETMVRIVMEESKPKENMQASIHRCKKEKLLCKLFFSLIEFIGVTLVNKTIQVSSVQLNKLSSAHCTMGSLPKVNSLSISIYPLPPPPAILFSKY